MSQVVDMPVRETPELGALAREKWAGFEGIDVEGWLSPGNVPSLVVFSGNMDFFEVRFIYPDDEPSERGFHSVGVGENALEVQLGKYTKKVIAIRLRGLPAKGRVPFNALALLPLARDLPSRTQGILLKSGALIQAFLSTKPAQNRVREATKGIRAAAEGR